jgi:hypothetical protein
MNIYSYKMLIIGLLLKFSISLNAQTGPGGVGTTDGTGTLKAWFDADQNVTYDGSNAVTAWDNKVSVTELNVSTFTGQGSPTFISTAQNGYPSVSFDGNDRLQTATTLNNSYFPSTEGSVFMVTMTDGNVNCTPWGTYPLSGQRFFGHLPWSSEYRFYFGSDETRVAYPAGNYGSFKITSYLAATGTASADLYTENSLVATGNAGAFSEHATHSFQFGDSFVGDICEFIMFTEKVNTVQRNIISNYLGGKYNLTLTANDMYSPDDASLNYGISGIGQEADGSITSNSSNGFNYSFASGNDNGEYLFVGNNNATNDVANIQTDANTTASGAEARWNRLWYIAKTGSYNVTLTIDFSEAFSSGLTPIGNIQNYVLLYRAGTSGDFTAVKSAYNVINSDQLVFNLSDADFSTGYFTIGSLDQTAGPVQGGSALTQSLIEGPAGIHR